MKKLMVGVCAAVAAAVSAFAAGEFKVGETTYDTFEAAVAAAGEGDTVEVVADGGAWSGTATFDAANVTVRSSEGRQFVIRRTSADAKAVLNKPVTFKDVIFDAGAVWSDPDEPQSTANTGVGNASDHLFTAAAVAVTFDGCEVRNFAANGKSVFYRTGANSPTWTFTGGTSVHHCRVGNAGDIVYAGYADKIVMKGCSFTDNRCSGVLGIRRFGYDLQFYEATISGNLVETFAVNCMASGADGSKSEFFGGKVVIWDNFTGSGAQANFRPNSNGWGKGSAYAMPVFLHVKGEVSEGSKVGISCHTGADGVNGFMVAFNDYYQTGDAAAKAFVWDGNPAEGQEGVRYVGRVAGEAIELVPDDFVEPTYDTTESFRVMNAGDQDWTYHKSFAAAVAALQDNGVLEIVDDDATLHDAVTVNAKNVTIRSAEGELHRLTRREPCTLYVASGKSATISNLILDGGAAWTSDDRSDRGNTGLQNGTLYLLKPLGSLTLADMVIENVCGLFTKACAGGGSVIYADNASTLNLNAGTVIRNCRLDASHDNSLLRGDIINGGNASFTCDGATITNNFCSQVRWLRGFPGKDWIYSVDISDNTVASYAVQVYSQHGQHLIFKGGKVVIWDNKTAAGVQMNMHPYPSDTTTRGYYVDVAGDFAEGSKVGMHFPTSGTAEGASFLNFTPGEGVTADTVNAAAFTYDLNPSDDKELVGLANDAVFIWKDGSKEDPVFSGSPADNPGASTPYTSLQQAFDEGEDGMTLTLLKGYELPETCVLTNKRFQLKLNGLAIAGAGRSIVVGAGGSLFVDGLVAGSALNGAIEVTGDGARVYLNGGTYEVGSGAVLRTAAGATGVKVVISDATLGSAAGTAIDFGADGSLVLTGSDVAKGCAVSGGAAALAMTGAVDLQVRNAAFAGAVTGTPAKSCVFRGSFDRAPSAALFSDGFFAEKGEGEVWNVVETNAVRYTADGGETWTTNATFAAFAAAYHATRNSTAAFSWTAEILHDTVATARFQVSGRKGDSEVTIRTAPELGGRATIYSALGGDAALYCYINNNPAKTDIIVENVVLDGGVEWFYDFDRTLAESELLAGCGIDRRSTGDQVANAFLTLGSKFDRLLFASGAEVRNVRGYLLAWVFAGARGTLDFGEGSAVRDVRNTGSLLSPCPYRLEGGDRRYVRISGGEVTRCSSFYEFNGKKGLFFLEMDTDFTMTAGRIHDNVGRALFCAVASTSDIGMHYSNVNLTGGEIVSNSVLDAVASAPGSSSTLHSHFNLGGDIRLTDNEKTDGSRIGLPSASDACLTISNALTRAARVDLSGTPVAGAALKSGLATVAEPTTATAGAERLFNAANPVGGVSYVCAIGANGTDLVWAPLTAYLDAETSAALEGDVTCGILSANPSPADLSCGTLTVPGTFTITEDSVLSIGLSDAQFKALARAGRTADLTLVEAGSIEGEFANVDLPRSWKVKKSGNRLVLRYLPSGLMLLVK